MATSTVTGLFGGYATGFLPTGDYKVEIFLGDASTPAMTRTFKVS